MKKLIWKRIGILLAALLLCLGLGACGRAQNVPEAQAPVSAVQDVSEAAASADEEETTAASADNEGIAVESVDEPAAEDGAAVAPAETDNQDTAPAITEDGWYTGKDEVAAYIHAFGHLPENYITKREAEDLGWVNREGNLGEVAPGKSIGGSRFGNYEGLLPEAKGRKYYECDIDFDGGYRGAKRLIYSDDGLIFYTEDHYETFEQLY